MATEAPLEFDGVGRASLDGTWDFFPGDHDVADIDDLEAVPIEVPGLWEAQGHLDLDGVAWYRRRFRLADVEGHWTLRFGAVMDLARVLLNGVAVGEHDLPFTPFELDVTGAVVAGDNEILVRVVDPPLGDPEHLRMPHGKQGWMNQVFPSRPSLYLTYGGIWQPVQLRRHGPVRISDVFVDGDPDDLTVAVTLENRTDDDVAATVGLRILGQVDAAAVRVGAGTSAVTRFEVGATTAARWSPEHPVRHHAIVDVDVAGVPSDLCTTGFGLRTVRVEGRKIVVDGAPLRMKSVLVQGFSAEALYAEGSREEIVAEVRAAKAAGFNMLRLHIKAFDPTYLDVCDEEGIYVHCDLPVAEPIEHEEMGGDTLLVRRCVAAITEQVRRDRNHPSVVLWSAMNELCDGRREARGWDAYETFARRLVATVEEHDPTRPVIENDWVEPDPDRIFASPIATAHWYGQLHADYFAKIEAACRRWSGLDRPFYVTEFGDWGLPQMPALADPAFWDTRALYEAGLAASRWPGTVERFVQETQRYQGLADRLQAEVWRRHDHIGGYCLTELTDVPQELNGILDLHRRPKPLAVAEVARGNQATLPILELATLVARAGDLVEGVLHVANDAPAIHDVEIELRFGDRADAADRIRVAEVAAHRASAIGPVRVLTPMVPGSHDLLLRLHAGGRFVAENRYPIHVVDPDPAEVAVRAVGDDHLRRALTVAGAHLEDGSPLLVVGEGSLDAASGGASAEVLAAGGVVLLLAQAPGAEEHLPLPIELRTVETVWGSTVFHFTTDHGAVPSLPRRNLLVAEDSTVQATSVVGAVDGAPFPDTPLVIAFKPVPGSMAGTILGAHDVAGGRLVLCQYRLQAGAAAGEPAALALLRDLLRWAGTPRRHLRRRSWTKPDGRRATAYRWSPAVAR